MLCGHVVQRIARDYGLDLTVFLYDAEGRSEHAQYYFQVKATDKLVRLRRTGEITLPVERGDVESWLRAEDPVILALYDAKEDVAYWLFVQGYFRSRPGIDLSDLPAKITVRIDPKHMLTEAAVKGFQAFQAELRQPRRSPGSVHHGDQ